MPTFQVGDRVVSRSLSSRVTGRLVSHTGVVVRTEVLGDEPAAGSSPLLAAVHRPGAHIYIVRHRVGGVLPIQMSWEQDEIELARDSN